MPQIVPTEVLDAGTLQSQASVLPHASGRPRKVNTRSGCFPSCRRNTVSAVALSGTAIGLRFFECAASTH